MATLRRAPRHESRTGTGRQLPSSAHGIEHRAPFADADEVRMRTGCPEPRIVGCCDDIAARKAAAQTVDRTRERPAQRRCAAFTDARRPMRPRDDRAVLACFPRRDHGARDFDRLAIEAGGDVADAPGRSAPWPRDRGRTDQRTRRPECSGRRRRHARRAAGDDEPDCECGPHHGPVERRCGTNDGRPVASA